MTCYASYEAAKGLAQGDDLFPRWLAILYSPKSGEQSTVAGSIDPVMQGALVALQSLKDLKDSGVAIVSKRLMTVDLSFPRRLFYVARMVGAFLGPPIARWCPRPPLPGAPKPEAYRLGNGIARCRLNWPRSKTSCVFR